MKIKLLLLLLIFLFSTGMSRILITQDAKFKGAMIYQYTRLIEWNDPADPFMIYIVGQSDVYGILSEAAKVKKVDNKNFAVQMVTNPELIPAADIIFLSESSVDQFSATLAKAAALKAVLITESDGLAKKGACINFIEASGRICYEVNSTSIAATGNKASEYFIHLARYVYQ